MSLDSVRQFFSEFAPDIKIIESSVSTATVQMAADALGVGPGQIAKTLALKIGEEKLLLVTAGDMKLDNSKVKAIYGVKPRMLDLDETIALTGHPIGGVTPVGLKEKIKVLCDVSLQRFERVYPAAGSTSTAFEITPERLAQLTDAHWVDVCK